MSKYIYVIVVFLAGFLSAQTSGMQQTADRANTETARQSKAMENLSCFNGRYIQGCVRAYLSKNKKDISVAATLRNHSNKTVMIGLVSTCYTAEGDYATGDSSCKQARSNLIKYSIPNARVIVGGISQRATEIPIGAPLYFKRWIDRDKISVNNLAALDPGGRMTLTYHFTFKAPVESSMFDFSSEAVMYVPSDSNKTYIKRKFTISGTDVFFPAQ